MTYETSLPPVVQLSTEELVSAASLLENSAQQEASSICWTDRTLADFLQIDKEKVADACARVQEKMKNMRKHFLFVPAEVEPPKKETKKMKVDRQNGQRFIFQDNEDYTLMDEQGAYLVLVDLQKNTFVADSVQRNLEAGIVYFMAPQKDKGTLQSYASMRARKLSDERLSKERKEFNGVICSYIGNYQRTILSKGYQAFTGFFDYRKELDIGKNKPTEYMPVRAIEAIRIATARTIAWCRQTKRVEFRSLSNTYCDNMQQARFDAEMDNSDFYDISIKTTHRNLVKASKEYWKQLVLPKRVITRQKAKPNNRKENNG